MLSHITFCVFILCFYTAHYGLRTGFELEKGLNDQQLRNTDVGNCDYVDLPCTCVNRSLGAVMNCSGLELTSVPKDLPRNTAYLLLKNNSFTKITSDSFIGLKELIHLDLSYNNISSFAEGALSHLKNLTFLDITMNEFLQFKYLRNVTYGFYKTSINTLKASFLHSPKHFPSTTVVKEDLQNLWNTTLEKLYLDGNQIQLLQRNVLSSLPKTLKFLSVKGNDLGNLRIQDLTIFGILALGSLTCIDISFQCNDYKLLKQEYLINSNARQHKHNLGSTLVFDNDSEVCHAPDISLENFNLNLTQIIARHAGLSQCISKWNFGKLHLEYIDVSQNNLMKWIGPLSIGSSQSLTHVDLSDNNCHYIGPAFFRNITSIETLDLHGNMLGATLNYKSESKFEKLINLYRVNLSLNGLDFIGDNVFKTQYKLQILNISGNNLKALNISISHMPMLRNIDLSYNQIADLPTHIMHQLDQNADRFQGNVSVFLMKNPIQCTCKQLEFWKWMYSSKVVVYLSENETCKHENDSTIYMRMFRNPGVMKQYSDMCRSHVILYVSIGLVTWLLMLILVVILYAKRWELRYRWYIYRLRRKGYTPLDGSRYDYEFDAFVSYAEKDADFVKTKMITKLETEYGCHLCLHERDFRVGEKIASNIISAIHNSNKTIVVLSPEYLNSNWCKYELHMANEEEHHQDRKVVVLLVLEQVKKRDLPAEVLEHYRTNTYIELPEHEDNMDTFWDALRESIS
ncbi:hypothetical protein FSP39_009533 [Pinctada imbricata]|uniref:TIR domain-containing protein n=1 Tax=Pinctada imbricata TaxID=66713 RepID=A0AA88XY40_PINIB|nr:hypothetical protein FSP39_009533 [Pinctada imbricata]